MVPLVMLMEGLLRVMQRVVVLLVGLMVRVLQLRQQVMVPLMVPMVRVLQEMQRMTEPLMMQMMEVLQLMPHFLGMVIWTSTHEDRSLDCWKTPAKGTASRSVVVMVRVL